MRGQSESADIKIPVATGPTSSVTYPVSMKHSANVYTPTPRPMAPAPGGGSTPTATGPTATTPTIAPGEPAPGTSPAYVPAPATGWSSWSTTKKAAVVGGAAGGVLVVGLVLRAILR